MLGRLRNEFPLETRQKLRFPIVASALGLRGVEQTLLGSIGAALQHVSHWRAKRFERRREFLTFFDRPRMTKKDRNNRLAMDFLREPGRRRREAQNHRAREFRRRF